MVRSVRVFAAVLLLALFAAPGVDAQSQATTGVIEGIVKDEGGGVLPGVTVTLRNTATGFEKVLMTDESGRFRGVLLPLGPYTTSFALEGFATLVREGLQLALGQTITLEVTMQISAVGEEITVTGAGPVIETSRTEGQIRIDDRSIEGLPNDGRNFLEFSKLTPGVTIVQGPDGEELSINGQKGINNNVMVDGADFNNPFFGEQRGGQRPPYTFNIDAIKEVLIVTDGAPAEFGRSSGGFVNVVTKSGTNSLKGTAHVFFKNDSLSEDPQLRSGGRETAFEFDQAQYGFTVGGPLRRDKAFFFVAADLQDADSTKQTDPGRIAPEVVDYLASVGLPNENAPITRTNDADAYLGKVDLQLNDRNLLTGRWAYHYSQQVNGTFDVDTWGASANGIETDYAHGLTSTLISTVSDRLLNEFRGQYAKEWRPRPYPGPNVPGQNRPFPDTAFDFVGGWRVGMPFFLPIEYDDDRIQINNNVSLLRGDHSIKAGLEYNEVTSSQTFIGFANGRYIFSSFQGFQNYVNLGPNYVECVDGTSGVGVDCSTHGGTAGPLLLFLQQAGVGDVSVNQAGTQSIEQKETAIFIQDQWQPTANLTLEFGLRWERLDQPSVITPPNEVFYADFIGETRDTPIGPQTFPSDGDIPDDDSLQPRFAFAWSPDTKLRQVIRGSAGVYAARIPALTLASVRSTNGSRGQTIFRASFFNDFGVTPPEWPNLLPPDVAGVPFQPEVFIFDKDFELPETISTALSWEGEVRPNVALLAKVNYAATNHITRWINSNDALFGSPWSTGLGADGSNGIGTLRTVSSSGKSRYFGVTVGVNKRYSNNFQVQAYYTNSIDQSDDDNERDPFTFRYAKFTDLDAEFSLSDRHQRHRFNAWVLWNAPYGIDINARFTYRDAQPLDIEPNGDPVQGFPPTGRCIPPVPSGSGLSCDLGAAVFGRNQGEKDNEFMTVDLRLSKNFQVGGYTVQPILDIFNLTDEENFLVPQVTELIFNFDGTVRSGAGDPREIQLGVRILR